MTDDEMLRHVRAHYARTLETVPVPPFDAVAPGEAGARAARWRWPAAAAGLAAALLVAVLVTRHDATSAPPDAADAEVARLMADLTSSTRWQAPSDRALTVAAGPSYLGVPDLKPKIYDPDEVTSWL